MSAITANAVSPIGCDARFKLTATLEAPSRARALVEATFTGWAFRHLIPDGKLIASELVTNSTVVTPGADVWLLLAQKLGAVLIGVWDSSPIMPKRRARDPDSSSGWGLHIVSALAGASGAFPVTNPRGKIAWARLAI